MALTIVLIIFTLVLSTIAIGLYIWWKRYGKKLFGLFEQMTNLKNSGFGGQKMPNFSDLQKQMNQFKDFFGKKK